MISVFPFVIVALFALKHFIADYPLQTESMLKKFSPDINEWSIALAKHCGVHLGLTFILMYFVSTIYSKMDNLHNLAFALAIACLNGTIHFIMDLVKANPFILGKYKQLSKNEFATATKTQKLHNWLFWQTLGLDQMVHHLTDIFCAYALCWWVQ